MGRTRNDFTSKTKLKAETERQIIVIDANKQFTSTLIGGGVSDGAIYIIEDLGLQKTIQKINT